jgi:contact-dependent growth inhibition (CDI) system CdiI-like immunity protein
VSGDHYALKNFFGSYFYPDWQLDVPSRGAVVADFLQTAGPGVPQALAKDLRDLLGRNLTEEQLHTLVLHEYSRFYDPWRHEISMREWLEGLLREVEQGVNG